MGRLDSKPMYYDRESKPIDMKRWAELHSDLSYRVIRRDTIEGHLVSTVWLGLDHGFMPEDPPLIFETMVFQSSEPLVDIYTNRYSTEEQAIEGHQGAIEWLHNHLEEEA